MTISTRAKILNGSLHAAFVSMAIAAFSASARAAESKEIMVQGPTTKTVGYDLPTGTPIQQTTVKIAVTYDPATLATDSGVALLKESVADAARKACATADRVTHDDGTCVRRAIDSAQAQIARLVLRQGAARAADSDSRSRSRKMEYLP
jgi:UrcA family protein